MIITAKDIEPYFCEASVATIQEEYPDGFEVTVDNLLKLWRQGLDVDWVLDEILGEEYVRYFPDGSVADFDGEDLWYSIYSFCEEELEHRTRNWGLYEPVIRHTIEGALPRAIEIWETVWLKEELG